MKRRRNSIVWWLVFLLGAVYFLLPLYATLDFSLKAKPPFAAYTNSFADPQFFSSLLYSFAVGVATIIGSLAAHRADRLLGPAPRPTRAARSSSSSRCCRS